MSVERLYKRTLADEIIPYLSTRDVVVIHGARQVGKTHLLYYLRNRIEENDGVTHYIDLEDSRYVRLLNQGVDELLKHLKEEGLDIEMPSSKRPSGRKHPRFTIFVDEIQYLDNPSSFLKLVADHFPQLKLVVSGSSSFAIKRKFQNSLVGRTVNFELFPLSFEEFLTFNEYAFYPELLRKNQLTDKKQQDLKSLYRTFVLNGGYPKIVLARSRSMKERYLQQIIDTYLKKDIRDLANVKNIEKFNKLLEVLASQSGNLVNIAELANTCNIAKQTVEEYLFILEQTYVIKLVHPYSKNLRSELFKTPKIFFYDSGLAQMLWLKGLQKEILGSVFETSIYAELVKRYGAEHVYYWRTMDKKEIDFIVKRKNAIIPIEAKLNFEQFRPTAIEYFRKKYRVPSFRVVGLEGKQKNPSFIHPWML